MADEFPRVRESYDAVAARYAEEYGEELTRNPLHRAIVDCFVTMVQASGLRGPVADIGCGPGHVTGYLADRGLTALGLDLSTAMIEVARERRPDIEFRVGTMTSLDVPDASWAGIAAINSIIHMPRDDRSRAYRELARALRPGGWMLIAFHVESAGAKPGDHVHLAEFLGQQVDLDGHFLGPDEVAGGLTQAGVVIQARFDREPVPDIEYPSRRTYLLGRRTPS